MFKDSSAARRISWVVILLLVMGGSLAACDSAPTVQRTPLPTAAPTSAIIPTAIVTLPRLASQVGWHDVVRLSDSTGSGAQSVQRSFSASKSYVIFFSCKGEGALKVSYGQTEETAPCSAKPELNGTQTLHPSTAGETVTVSVLPSGAIAWELLVSMQN